jgi:S-DNA-T family DNA segregation ATPase FtsK/SpoIIIE
MAKKKKRTVKRKALAPVERSPFWAYTGAVVLVLLAFLLLIGGFGTGGPLPVDLFHGAYWLFGWAAYLTPVVLAAWGIYKFAAEDRRLSVGQLSGMTGLLLFASCWGHTAFASKAAAGGWQGGHGGQVGRVVGNVVLSVLDKIPASLVFFVFTLLAAFFAFGVDPKILLKLAELFKRPERAEDNDLAALKAKAGDQPGFKLNEGVPVVHHSAGEPARLSTLKNTAQKLAGNEQHEALTTASDPNWQFPSIDLLNQKQDKADAGDVNANAQIIHDTFENFNIEVEMEGANIGPRVTQYTLKPPTGVKLTKITALENNLALDLAAHSIRMEAPIPGKRAVGIEVPNVKSATVRVSSILLSQEWQNQTGPLELRHRQGYFRHADRADLDKMPHHPGRRPNRFR